MLDKLASQLFCVVLRDVFPSNILLVATAFHYSVGEFKKLMKKLRHSLKYVPKIKVSLYKPKEDSSTETSTWKTEINRSPYRLIAA